MSFELLGDRSDDVACVGLDGRPDFNAFDGRVAMIVDLHPHLSGDVDEIVAAVGDDNSRLEVAQAALSALLVNSSASN